MKLLSNYAPYFFSFFFSYLAALYLKHERFNWFLQDNR